MKPLNVAVLIETSGACGRGMLLGLADYMRGNGQWIIHRQEQSLMDRVPDWLRAWRGDGVLTRMENPEALDWIRNLKVPVVQIHDTPPFPDLPSVSANNGSIAGLVFEHFRERGFRHFAFCGFHGAKGRDDRRDAFTRLVNKSGFHCHVFPGETRAAAAPTTSEAEAALLGYLTADDRELVVQWLTKLPKPIGLMACNDIRGQQLTWVCHSAGVAVPDEIAIIGVHNDDVLCELSTPALSSVASNARRAGHQAAVVLARVIAGERLPSRHVFVEPAGIVARRSTETLAVEDRQVATAVRFIHERACSGIAVRDVARAAAMSERTLERRFATIMGRSPGEEILRVRINKAKQLLAETDFSLNMIAEKTGFEYTEYISRIFKKKVGVTPGRFRTRSQNAAAADKLASHEF
ncbi:MAG: XylR family transcriptional regulator [Verrucomicrobia bacterium]|nr:XylR family transcriptional regulator [Verrucomicrobiota bacterium]MDE3099190.1 XylR family transcriptional regulator [Verrucomicrobiota bacterium]